MRRVGNRTRAATVCGFSRQGVFARGRVGPRQRVEGAVWRGAPCRNEGAESETVRALEKFDVEIVAILGVLRVSPQCDAGRSGEDVAVLRRVQLHERRVVGSDDIVVGNDHHRVAGPANLVATLVRRTKEHRGNNL